jgi:hypothetical protein
MAIGSQTKEAIVCGTEAFCFVDFCFSVGEVYT